MEFQNIQQAINHYQTKCGLSRESAIATAVLAHPELSKQEHTNTKQEKTGKMTQFRYFEQVVAHYMSEGITLAEAMAKAVETHEELHNQFLERVRQNPRNEALSDLAQRRR